MHTDIHDFNRDRRIDMGTSNSTVDQNASGGAKLKLDMEQSENDIKTLQEGNGCSIGSSPTKV